MGGCGSFSVNITNLGMADGCKELTGQVTLITCTTVSKSMFVTSYNDVPTGKSSQVSHAN